VGAARYRSVLYIPSRSWGARMMLSAGHVVRWCLDSFISSCSQFHDWQLALRVRCRAELTRVPNCVR
jgi:hypothetical protein